MTAVDTLLSILDLETLEANLFRGNSPQDGWQRVFGGQVIGQALVAASRTLAEAWPAHSLHGYFLLAGDPSIPIIYEVDPIRDGRSFATRRVNAIQHGRAIFTMNVSFQQVEDGMEHQMTMPDIPGPDDLPSEAELKAQFLHVVPEPVRKYWERDRPIELRYTDLRHFISKDVLPPKQVVWFKATGPVPENPPLQQCWLAYASDMTLLDTSLYAHGMSVFHPRLQAASLDHALWYHRPYKADEWHVYVQDSPSSSAARGFARGAIYNEAGVLVASSAQEGLIRMTEKQQGGF